MKVDRLQTMLLVAVLLIIGLSVFDKFRRDPLEDAIFAYLGSGAVDCGIIRGDQLPNTIAISGCVADARTRGKSFRVRRDIGLRGVDKPFQQGGLWTTAIAGLADGGTRTFYIDRRLFGGTLVSNAYVPDGGYKWTLDMDDVRGHQLKIEFR